MTGSFPLIFLFCVRWRECWIRSDPSVIVIITWNINANEDVCQRVNEGSLMWLSVSVHRQTRACVVFIWTSHLSSSLRFHSWLFTDMSLLVFPMISSLIGQQFLWSFYPATRGTDIFTSHLIPGLWKPSCFEVIVEWMCHWKLIRDSWLGVENVLCSWFQSFSSSALSFCQKPFGLSCSLFSKADNHFFNSHDLAVPGLPAPLIMVYLNSLYLKLVFTLLFICITTEKCFCCIGLLWCGMSMLPIYM